VHGRTRTRRRAADDNRHTLRRVARLRSRPDSAPGGEDYHPVMAGLRSRSGRALVVDACVVALLLVVAVAGSRQATDWQGARPLDALGYTLIAVAVGALLARRRWPEAVMAVSTGACVLWLAVGYARGPIMLAPAVALYTLAARRPVRRSLAAAMLGVAALMAGHIPELLGGATDDLPTDLPTLLAWASGWTVVPWAVGAGVRQARAERERDRAETARRIAYEERLRVAREVHDVVGHGLAVINMQAGVALHVLGKRQEQAPEQTRAALEAIRTASKDALEDLRGTLAVFRQADQPPGGDQDHPRQPAPGLDQLEVLVTEMRRGGLPVSFEVSGTGDGVPGPVELAAYRIVQESLTNVLRHAGPAAARVRVVRAPAAVEVEVTDDGRGRAAAGAGRRPAEPGHGITGMRERAAAVGGSLDAGPLPAGGWRVHASLPTGTSGPSPTGSEPSDEPAAGASPVFGAGHP
jgi:signal transduction histidine kinase